MVVSASRSSAECSRHREGSLDVGFLTAGFPLLRKIVEQISRERREFGEIALLQRIPRTLMVWAVTDVDVLAIKARAFVSLFSNLPALRDSFQQMMGQRLEPTKHNVQRSHGHTESPP